MATSIEIYLHIPDPQMYADLMRAAIRHDRRTMGAQPLARGDKFIPDLKGADKCYTPGMVNERGGADCSSLVRAEAGAPMSEPGYSHVGILKDPNSADGYHAFLVKAHGPMGNLIRSGGTAGLSPDKDPVLSGHRLTMDLIKDPCVDRGMRPAPTLADYNGATFVTLWQAGESVPMATGAEIDRAERNYFSGKAKHPLIGTVASTVAGIDPRQALDKLRNAAQRARRIVVQPGASAEASDTAQTLSVIASALQTMLAGNPSDIAAQLSTAKSAIDNGTSEQPLAEKVLAAYQQLANTFPDLLKTVIGAATGDAGINLDAYLPDPFASAAGFDPFGYGSFSPGTFNPSDMFNPFGGLSGLAQIEKKIPPGCGGSCSMSAGWD
jgi:hypothetical protein